ncbi:MAG: hypothetical protein ACLR2E_04495 [Lachnospiraceae bacterium]
MELLVQVCRENLKSKPPAVTSNLNFTGNYVVLTTENKSIGFSSKLSKEEKQQLRVAEALCQQPLWLYRPDKRPGSR